MSESGFIRVWKVGEICSMTKFCRKTVLGWIYDGTLPAMKIGGEWRVSAPALTDFLERHSKGKVEATGATAETELNGA